MVGHVNMMDDVLISNLPPEYLRSALRVLIAEGSAIQQPFVRHVRDRLQDPKPKLYPARELFPGADELTPKCTTYLSLTRCLFSSKLVQLSLPYLDHLIRSLSEANATWTGGSELHRVLGDFSGDIVQAMQALKEVDPAKDDVLKGQLLKLHSSLLECRHYCEAHEPTALEYPFRRSERQVVDVVDIFYPGHSSDLVPGRGDSEVPDFLDISFGEVAETFVLGPFHIPRLFNGFWQLSSPAWGAASSNSQDAALTQLLHSGLTAADMADHYGDAELVYGQFRNRLPQQVKHKVFAATKWCVFKPIGCKVTDEWVLEAVKERCRRLGGRVELLQFHWYDYDAKEYLDVLLKLVALTKTHPELVSTIGLCNFDSSHVQEACEYLLSRIGAVGIVSNQIQVRAQNSTGALVNEAIVLRHRFTAAPADVFDIGQVWPEATHIWLCGGFLSSRWLNQRLPTMYSASRQLTPSQRKYLGMISDWGSWDDFQALLSRLSVVAEKHSGATLTNVAIRWVLQKPQVGAVIVGTRLGITTHDQDNLSVLKFRLDEEDTKVTHAMAHHDEFELYDLRVEVICPPGERILCGAKEGDYFTLQGEMLFLPQGQGISIYSLSSVLPLLAAKQRMTHKNDWMTTDALIACPDPNCKSQLKIIRTGLRKFHHSETTAGQLSENDARPVMAQVADWEIEPYSHFSRHYNRAHVPAQHRDREYDSTAGLLLTSVSEGYFGFDNLKYAPASVQVAMAVRLNIVARTMFNRVVKAKKVKKANPQTIRYSPMAALYSLEAVPVGSPGVANGMPRARLGTSSSPNDNQNTANSPITIIEKKLPKIHSKTKAKIIVTGPTKKNIPLVFSVR
ncbi:hypothetical protein NPX13_g5633 [Xylaria arbuscula]|uniref:NADP-dependent oxidoreductase domain-containing protein n=1 Tax=Xylaria arbuscula TaxID=114810 RepID=A0A9W8NE50_9PEZI|nr:hypothetical protein NPX13_g5633 [Xylaria arbuscula]